MHLAALDLLEESRDGGGIEDDIDAFDLQDFTDFLEAVGRYRRGAARHVAHADTVGFVGCVPEEGFGKRMARIDRDIGDREPIGAKPGILKGADFVLILAGFAPAFAVVEEHRAIGVSVDAVPGEGFPFVSATVGRVRPAQANADKARVWARAIHSHAIHAEFLGQQLGHFGRLLVYPILR